MPIRYSSAIDDGKNGNIAFSGIARRNDGNIEFITSEDGMLVTATLYPPIGEGNPLTTEYACEILARSGISYGTLLDELAENIFTVNTERRVLKDLIVATGKPPVAAQAEHVVLFDRFKSEFVPFEDETEIIDWHQVSSYRIVNAGEQVGKVIPKQEGQDGIRVNGEKIPCKVETSSSYALGKNITRQKDGIFASASGKLAQESGKLSVEEVLLIKGNVDYHVGHVMFPGDVIIDGTIAPGFKVYAGGSITIKDTMDAFDVNAKKDLLCGQGIIGREQGFVRVGGMLKAKFVESAHVAVRGDVEIPGALVATKLYTLGTLRMGDKGKIVGGEVFATHGVFCGYLGGSTNPVTAINIGVDFTMQQKLDQANAALRELSARLNRLIDLAKSRPEAQILKLRDETEVKVRALAQNIAELSKQVDSDPGAVVEVKNAVYPGVAITICHVRIIIEKPMKKSRFHLDTVAGKIIIEQ